VRFSSVTCATTEYTLVTKALRILRSTLGKGETLKSSELASSVGGCDSGVLPPRGFLISLGVLGSQKSRVQEGEPNHPNGHSDCDGQGRQAAQVPYPGALGINLINGSQLITVSLGIN
jgi:hypothetical protein